MDDAYYDDYFTHIIASLKPFKITSIQNIYINEIKIIFKRQISLDFKPKLSSKYALIPKEM